MDPWDEWGSTLSWQVFLRAQRKSPALVLEASGPDETVLEGLFTRLAEILSPRARRPRWLTRQTLALLAALTVLLCIPLLDPLEYALGFPASDGYLTAWELLVEASVVGATTLIALLLYWALPDFEVIPVDGKPRFNRSFRMIAATVGVLVTEVVASVFAAAVFPT